MGQGLEKSFPEPGETPHGPENSFPKRGESPLTSENSFADPPDIPLGAENYWLWNGEADAGLEYVVHALACAGFWHAKA